MHLLAQLVEALDYVGVGADTQFLGFLREQLGVDQVAQQIFLLWRVLRRGVGILLGLFGRQLLFTVLQVRTGNDAVIDASDDLLDHCHVVRLGWSGCWRDSRGRNRSGRQGRLALLSKQQRSASEERK